MRIFELIMLIMFGISWPVSIYKSLKTRKTGSKSAFFLGCIIVGYASGIINKAINGFDYVSYMYIFNLVMVSIDLGLFFRNKKLEQKED